MKFQFRQAVKNWHWEKRRNMNFDLLNMTLSALRNQQTPTLTWRQFLFYRNLSKIFDPWISRIEKEKREEKTNLRLLPKQRHKWSWKQKNKFPIESFSYEKIDSIEFAKFSSCWDQQEIFHVLRTFCLTFIMNDMIEDKMKLVSRRRKYWFIDVGIPISRKILWCMRQTVIRQTKLIFEQIFSTIKLNSHNNANISLVYNMWRVLFTNNIWIYI